jgi:chromosome transmission fidelity protein 18
MLDDFEKARYERALKEAAAVDDECQGISMDSAAGASTDGRDMTSGELKAARWRGKVRGMLWAQRHAPRTFVDLLSAEQSNREVVHWIKGWDKAVFGRDPPPATMKKFYSDRYAEKNGMKKRNNQPETHTQLDARGRPIQKILLISGPPGAGKTTLAYIAAKHCGYDPLEINASDDRGAVTLKAKLADSVHTQSVFGNQKPTCLIIDEIDGVHNGGNGGGAIWTVVNALKSSKGRAPLSRPIIAICNDLYAPVLRPLREVAKIVRMKVPSTNMLTARIRDVCVKENVNAEPRAIALIVDRVENDIRAALNAVQLIAKTSSTVTLTDVVQSDSGAKDIKHQSWSMWQDLLRGRHTFPKSRLESERKRSHMDKMRDRIETFQDNDSLVDGLFENMPLVRFQDGNMKRLTNAIEAVVDASLFQTKSFSTGDESLRQYASSCLLIVHSCATHADVLQDNMEMPKTGRAVKENKGRMEILHSRRDALDLKIMRRSIAEDVTQTLPHLNTIIAPELRSVGTSFMSTDEKIKLEHIVNLMRAQGLSYKAPESKFEQSWRAAANALVLDPPIDDFVKFGGGVEALKSVERLTWKERREREREPAETSSGPKHINLVPRRPVNNSLRSIIAASLVTDAERRSGAATLRASADASAQRADAKARVALGVAGGNRHKLKAGSTLGAPCGPKYTYNEGFTTGVRRTLLMRDLFPNRQPLDSSAP